MSGYKHATVTISQEEYRRLQEADIKKRFKEFTRITSQDSSQNEVVSNLIKELEARELQLHAALSSLTQNPNPSDEELIRTIQNQNTLYYENLATILRESNTDVENAFAYLTGEFSQALLQEREQVYQSIQSILYEQDSHLDKEFAKGEAAQDWLNRCLGFLEFIQCQFDHERFAPGRLDRVLRNLQYAESNLTNGYYEISIQNSQQSYLDLLDLNLELEQVLLQWQTAFATTYEAINDFIYQMDSNVAVNGLDLDGRELPDLVELDFWTNGKYRQLFDHSKKLSIYMNEDRNLLTYDDIDRIHSQVLPAIRESFESIVFEARLNALNSQLRMNIAEKALLALEEHGFVLDIAGYSDNDMREQFNAHLECVDGSQVTIRVIPTENSSQEFSNELEVITTHPYLKTDHEAQLQWEELSHTLSQYKLKVSRPEIITSRDTSSAEISEQTRLIEQSKTHIER